MGGRAGCRCDGRPGRACARDRLAWVTVGRPRREEPARAGPLQRVGRPAARARHQLGLEEELRGARAITSWERVVEEHVPAAAGASRLVELRPPALRRRGRRRARPRRSCASAPAHLLERLRPRARRRRACWSSRVVVRPARPGAIGAAAVDWAAHGQPTRDHARPDRRAGPPLDLRRHPQRHAPHDRVQDPHQGRALPRRRHDRRRGRGPARPRRSWPRPSDTSTTTTNRPACRSASRRPCATPTGACAAAARAPACRRAPSASAAAVVRNDELYLATVGPVEAYLVRGARLLMPDRSAPGGLPSEEGRPIDVWRGELSVGDALLLVSRNVTQTVGTEELKSAVLTLHPQAAAEHLHHLFVAMGGEGSDGLIVVEASEQTRSHRRVSRAGAPTRMTTWPARRPCVGSSARAGAAAGVGAGSPASSTALWDAMPRRRARPRPRHARRPPGPRRSAGPPSAPWRWWPSSCCSGLVVIVVPRGGDAIARRARSPAAIPRSRWPSTGPIAPTTWSPPSRTPPSSTTGRPGQRSCAPATRASRRRPSTSWSDASVPASTTSTAHATLAPRRDRLAAQEQRPRRPRRGLARRRALHRPGILEPSCASTPATASRPTSSTRATARPPAAPPRSASQSSSRPADPTS